MSTVIRLTAAQRQSVSCHVCGVQEGRPCKGSRIPGANTLGGGWGGPSSLKREHEERVTKARVLIDAAALRERNAAFRAQFPR